MVMRRRAGFQVAGPCVFLEPLRSAAEPWQEAAMISAAAAFPVHAVVRLLQALGDETRLRIVALLTHGELCVCHVEKALDVTQPTASRHLAVLRAAEVVKSRRDAGWVYYRLAPQTDPDCQSVLRTLSRSFGKQDTLRRDVETLTHAKKADLCGRSNARATKSTPPAVKVSARRKAAEREVASVPAARKASGSRTGAKKAARRRPDAGKVTKSGCSDCGAPPRRGS